jgi:hypothetical protein
VHGYSGSSTGGGRKVIMELLGDAEELLAALTRASSRRLIAGRTRRRPAAHRSRTSTVRRLECSHLIPRSPLHARWRATALCPGIRSSRVGSRIGIIQQRTRAVIDRRSTAIRARLRARLMGGPACDDPGSTVDRRRPRGRPISRIDTNEELAVTMPTMCARGRKHPTWTAVSARHRLGGLGRGSPRLQGADVGL